jgi:gliding motility-associated-like protein
MTIPAGQTTTTDKLTVLAFEDGVKEPTEYFLAEIQEPSSSILVDIGRSAQVEIEDVFPTAAAPNGPNENGDIRPDPLTSPNEDGIGNDGFFIYNISAYPDNEVVIFNRWGNEVFRLKNYDNHSNSFRGRANKGLTNTSTDLVDGVYYYLIYTRVNGVQKTNKGYIILKRKK